MSFDRGHIEDVRHAGKASIRSLVKHILPDPQGYFSGAYYFCRNPGRTGKPDRRVGSFFVFLTGAAAGGWRDTSSGEQGDVIDLVALALRLSRGDAIKWLANWTGIRQLTGPALLAKQAEWREEERRTAHEDARELDELRRRAKALWLSGKPIAPPAPGGAPSPAWRYLTEARAIDLPGIGGAPSLLRWLPSHKHVDSGREWPCIAAGIVDMKGDIIGVHRTWLRHDGLDKAPVRSPRKVWPRGISGGLIWLSRGASKHGPIEAGRRGESSIVILAEGIEDALTAAMAEREARVAAFISLGYLGDLSDMPWASGYVVLRDNDWASPQAVAQFDDAFARLQGFGKPCEWIASPHGKDFNDLAQAISAGAL
ncbi:DUF7146 domain-containing protein [Ancylobacter terrae]|uniref:DUF7146 domain-containing protein n=1 Tax=Ancylobacter sp. sgz301288 TaxID=3342077 RepID=UPI00385EB92D